MRKEKPLPEDQKFNPGDLASLAHATNIDRRKCRRTVPMRVLGLGLSRTGTASLRQALIDLGYKECYHFSTPLQENPPDQTLWIEALEAKFEAKRQPYTLSDWDQLLGHCQATTDNPSIIFYKELLEMYPEAKVVVTIRDNATQWQRSYNETIGPFFDHFIATPRTWLGRMYRLFMPVDPRLVRLCNLCVNNSPIFNTLQRDYLNGTNDACELYYEYLEELKRLIPPEKLLVMNVKEGWEPLCAFLGEEVPAYPFPRKNDTISFQRNNAALGEVMYAAANWKLLRSFGLGMAVAIAFGTIVYRFGISTGRR